MRKFPALLVLCSLVLCSCSNPITLKIEKNPSEKKKIYILNRSRGPAYQIALRFDESTGKTWLLHYTSTGENSGAVYKWEDVMEPEEYLNYIEFLQSEKERIEAKNKKIDSMIEDHDAYPTDQY